MVWKLYEGNCFDYLPLLEDKSIDMILCDLPYGTTDCKWDTPLPLDKLWFEYKRIIKDNGAIVLTASQPFTSKLVSSNYEMFKYALVWVKNQSTNFVHAKNKPLKKHEDILVFSKGTTVHESQSDLRMNYNPQGIKEVNIYHDKTKGHTDTCFSKRPSHGAYVTTHTGYPTSIINIDCERGLHPTQKPVALFEYLIKTYTNEDELVLDNCAGSGTTGVACENTGRNSILMEQEPEYCQIIKDRMATVQELQLEARKQKTLNEFNGQATLDMPAK
jgi:site-specific DNA-methyltransferase (adenine-specific)